MENEKSELAGETVKIISGELAGSDYRVEDWWENVSGKSWMFSQGNMACIKYAVRNAKDNLPVDNDVLYGKIGAFGHLVHITEIEYNIIRDN